MQAQRRRVAKSTTWAIIAFAVLLGFGSFYALEQVKQKAKEIVLDTVPGLSNAGLAGTTLTQSFVYTLLIVQNPTAPEKQHYLDELVVNTQRTTDSLNAYAKSVFSEEDRLGFEDLQRKRAVYLARRQQCIDLSQSDAGAAQKQLMAEIWPLYEAYRDQCDKVLKFNIAQGIQRGEQILRIASAAQFVAVVASVLIFLGGFIAAMVRVVTSIEW